MDIPYRRIRVRTGCVTCKRRKLKCDETHPHCGRCLKSGFRCEGYIAKDPRRQLAKVANPGSLGFDATSLFPGFRFKNMDEKQSLSYFLESTVPMLSGNLGSSFWHYYIPQLAQTDPTIWHALMALGAVHHSRRAGLAGAPGGVMTGHNLAIEHYHKSMHLLHQRFSYNDDESLRVVLVSSLLFTILEVLMANYESGAMVHLRSGLDILGNLRTAKAKRAAAEGRPITSRNDSDAIEDHLVHLFADLELQAATVLSGRKSSVLGMERRRRLCIPSELKNEFHTVFEAKWSLDNELSAAYDFYNWTLPHRENPSPESEKLIQDQYAERLTRLDKWCTVFRRLLRENDEKLTREELRGAVQLKIMERFCRILLDTTLKPDEKHELVPDHAAMVKMIRLATDHDEDPRATNGSNAKLCSLTFGILMPLYFTVQCCPNQSVRKEAVMLLKRHPRREGFWDGDIISEVAAKVMEHGEAQQALASDGEVVDSELWSVILDDMAPFERRGVLRISSVLTESVALHEEISW